MLNREQRTLKAELGINSVFAGLVLGLAFLCAVNPCQARTITVDDDGPADFNNIQAAINDANAGDVVVVQPGTYTGYGNRDIDFLGKAITVQSTDPNNEDIIAGTVVDCENSGRGFYFDSNEGTASILAGLTVTNGKASGTQLVGGGIYCYQGSPTISRCNIRWNQGGIGCGASTRIEKCDISYNSVSGANGGGVNCGGSATFSECHIHHNSAIASGPTNYRVGGFGGGVSCTGRPTFTNCTITENSADVPEWPWDRDAIPPISRGRGGGVYCLNGRPLFSGSIIKRNFSGQDGGGIYCEKLGTVDLINCTIESNSAASYGGGIYLSSISPATLRSCIVWHNEAANGAQIYLGSSPMGPSTVQVDYCVVDGGWLGTGNLDVDPLLTWDGHLRAESLCINAGDPNQSVGSEERDIDGESRIIDGRIDIGVDEFLDTDSDKIQDYWEKRYFGSITECEPNDDPDEDGWTNLEEYLYGTEPNMAPVTYYVDPVNGSDRYDGLSSEWDGLHGPMQIIQNAIWRCAQRRNDSIVLLPGIYSWVNDPFSNNVEVRFYGRAITIRSKDPTDPCVVAATVIDCGARYRAFNFDYGETPASKVCGVTIRNGYGNVGGAIYCSKSSPTISYCVIEGSRASENGGAIYCQKSNPVIAKCVITGNSAEKTGGGIYCEKGNPMITGCIITNNSALYLGGVWGGVYLTGGGGTLSHCTIIGNSGYGVYAFDDDIVISYSTICNNNEWGGISCWRSVRPSCNCTIKDCTISGNNGPGMYCGRVSLTMRNCTITGNLFGGMVCQSGGAIISNSIFWNNGRTQIFAGGTVDVDYSDVQDGWAGEGNIDADPCFVAPGYWDANGTPDDANDDFWVNGDYHLMPGSPCVDAGDPNYAAEVEETDLDGNPRVMGGRIDIGAYELRPVIAAYIDICPTVLNLQSQGRWVLCFIRLPKGYDVAEIERDSVLLEEQIRPQMVIISRWYRLATAIFSKEEVVKIVKPGRVELTVSGQLKDGSLFRGKDVIWVIRPFRWIIPPGPHR